MNEPAPEITFSYDQHSLRAIFTRGPGLRDAVWARLTATARDMDERASITSSEVALPWLAGVSTLEQISSLRNELGFSFRPDTTAIPLLERLRDERRRLRDLRDGIRAEPLSESQIRERLTASGWDFAKRDLKQFQVRDLQRLTGMHHGANFSVPGSGKTTVTFALHLLIRRNGTHLLVIAPKNALVAWDDVVGECITGSASDPSRTRFLRVDGTDEEVRRILYSGHNRFVMTYDRATRVAPVLQSYLATHDVHLVLDESHRIKAGQGSARGRTLMGLRHLPTRRDILTGTPVPNSLSDLVTQIDYLYPNEPFGRKLDRGERARDVIATIYVRTTKRDLDIPPMNPIHFELVQMSPAQAAFYNWLRANSLPVLRRALRQRRISRPLRGTVMRLLQASTNAPPAATRAFEDILTAGDIPERLLEAVLVEGDSAKLLRAAAMAREIVTRGRRALIWSTTYANIDRLTDILTDVGATSIDGRTPTGASDDPQTREGRVSAFHRADGPKVLVANPAACSEGISLHHACHDAIYVERTYNAGHFLQSLDRIHRLGLPAGTETNVTILQSALGAGETVDQSVSRRLKEKLDVMTDVLGDPDVRQLALDEEEGDPEDLSRDIDFDDLQDLIDVLEGTAHHDDDGG